MTISSTKEQSIFHEDLMFIADLVYEHSRIKLTSESRELVSNRLYKRLKELKLSDFQSYCQFLRSPAGAPEVSFLIDVISTNHTYFFREQEHFNFLKKTIVPEYLQTNQLEPLSIWSAACSSGQEPYSIAITLNELNTSVNFRWDLQASDISNTILAAAKKAEYVKNYLAQVPAAYFIKYFKALDGKIGHYRLADEIKRKVHFKQANLFDSHSYAERKFHVIFCRNVFIYFSQEDQIKVVNFFKNRLLPGGYLIIGHAENLVGMNHGFFKVQPSIFKNI